MDTPAGGEDTSTDDLAARYWYVRKDLLRIAVLGTMVFALILATTLLNLG